MYSPAEGSLYHPVVIKDNHRFWKRILIVDDEADVTVTFKTVIEESNNNNDVNNEGLSEFKPNFYDLLLVDINMLHMNVFDLCEKILAIDATSPILGLCSLPIQTYQELPFVASSWILLCQSSEMLKEN